MPGLLALLIEEMLDHPVPLGWDASREFPGSHRLTERVAVIVLVGNERFCRWQARIEKFRTSMFAHLAFGQQHGE